MTRFLARRGLRLTDRGRLLADLVTAAVAAPLAMGLFTVAWLVLHP